VTKIEVVRRMMVSAAAAGKPMPSPPEIARAVDIGKDSARAMKSRLMKRGLAAPKHIERNNAPKPAAVKTLRLPSDVSVEQYEADLKRLTDTLDAGWPPEDTRLPPLVPCPVRHQWSAA
jgi:hypothetical protein